MVGFPNGFPKFCKLDGNDQWVESCGSTKCSQNHNIRRSPTMLPSTCMDMNWLDFLDVLDCYRRERVAICKFCKAAPSAVSSNDCVPKPGESRLTAGAIWQGHT